MSNSNRDIEAILQRVEETLQTAKHGLDDLLQGPTDRRMSGLRNLIVFGRAVTFVLQNLRSVVPEEFDVWYAPQQETLKNDPLMRYFVDARNEIEKQGKLRVGTFAHLKSFSDNDISKLGPRPPGAKGFFIGDHLGGMGWVIELPDGSEEKYYANFPASIAEVKQFFLNLPLTQAPELQGATIEDLSQRFIERMTSLVAAAHNRFLSAGKVSQQAKISKSHLRLVK